ncbi:MAG TPA: EAL domain-containing protein, partial [Gallionella sp.]|nr:EAL domain-containing protein [Gallionella sp.]
TFIAANGQQVTFLQVYVPEYAADGSVQGALGMGRDITAIKQAEAQLAKERATLRTFFDAMPDLAWMKDPEGRYLACNPMFEQLYGAREAEILGKTDFDFVDAELAAFFREKDKEAEIAGRPCVNEEWVTFAGDGRHALVETVKSPVTDAAGRVVGIIGVAHDITERKLAEQYEQFRSRVMEFLAGNNSLPDILAEIVRGVERLSPRMLCSILLLDSEGKRLVDGVAPSLPDFYNAAIDGLEIGAGVGSCGTCAATGERVVVEDIQTHPYWAPFKELAAKAGLGACWSQPVRSSSGEVLGTFAIYHREVHRPTARDIFLIENTAHMTSLAIERKRTEEALRHSEQLMRTVIDATPDWIFVKDREHRYHLANQGYADALHIAPEDFIGKNDLDLGFPEELVKGNPEKDIRGFWADDRLVLESNETQVYPDDPATIDGAVHTFHTIKVPLRGDDGKPWGVLAFARDITARRRAELVLEENARLLEEQAVELEASKEQLMATEAWYRGILQSAPDGMVVVDEFGIIRLVNEQLCRMFGYGDGELSGQPVEQLVPLDVREGHQVLRAGFAASDSQGRAMAGCVGGGLRGRRKDGSEFFIDVSLARLPDVDGATGAICAAIRDITERKRMEQALAEREQEFRTLIENSADTVARYGRDCRRLYVNPAFAELADGGAEALIGKRPTEFPGGTNADLYEMKLGEVLAGGTEAEFELTWPDKDGQEICSLIKLTPEFGKDGSVESVLAVGRDITELNEHRNRIYQMAFYDGLTSLPNRALFNDRLRQMITDAEWHGQMAGVMLLDLDRFKAVNDTLGHPAGDELLREAAARLTGCVRAYDTVARLGGDEFAVLLPEVRSGDDLGVIAGKILQSFGEPFLLEGKEVFVSSSIGIALYPEDGGAADDLIKYADSAMYFAKRSGRNNFRFYSKELTVSANERLVLEGDLRRGFGRGELELHFQPKVRLADGRLVGSEALLRWKHPQRGMVPPDKFISIAEDSGLIVEIGEWVLRTACRTACSWNAPGKSLHKVAINLSARQFQSGLVDCVRNVLEETGCYPEWVELEITESLLLDEGGEVLEILNAFRAMGISIAIDDFGTGYSALSYLARYPIDTLKIDRSFISRLCEYGHHAELVKAIISIARSLDQQVVAEGVESAEEVAVLQSYGCQMVQGYFYGKPMPEDVFADFSAKWGERRGA